MNALFVLMSCYLLHHNNMHNCTSLLDYKYTGNLKKIVGKLNELTNSRYLVAYKLLVALVEGEML